MKVRMKIKRLGPVSRIKLLSKSTQASLLNRPFASEVVENYVRQRNYPNWTSFFIKYNSVVNDHFSFSCFNFQVDQHNYQILKTGCYPFIKYHCTKTRPQNLYLQNKLFTIIKILNFGLATLIYGFAAIFFARHKEIVNTSKGLVTIYFWYKEDYGALF